MTTTLSRLTIFICYGYDAHTTGTYFEKALSRLHDVHYIGPSWRKRLGRSTNEDLSSLVREGTLPKPDLVLFIESGMRFFPRGLETLACPTAAYIIDVHQDSRYRQKLAIFFDHIFLCHKDYVDRFATLVGHPNVHWLPVACDPEIHGKLDVGRTLDVGFVGHLSGHPARRRLLLGLEKRYATNDYRKFYPKEEIAEIYSKSKIAFNYAINKDLNMRVFEALAGGALLLTNHIDNGIGDLLTVGQHFVEYTDEQSLLEKIDYYLLHDIERERIAEAGRAIVIAKHTYDLRCQAMLDTIFASQQLTGAAIVRAMNAKQLRAAYGDVYVDMRLADAALDEFDIAWSERAGRWTAAKNVALAVLKRLNGITLLTARSKRRRQSR